MTAGTEMHFATLWEAVARAVPERPALTHGGVTRTWREVDERAGRFARALVDAGLEPDAKVGLYLYNCSEYLEAEFGAMKARAVPVNINYRYLDVELVHLLTNSDAQAIVFHSSLADRVARAAASVPGLRLLVQVDDDGTALIDGAVGWDSVVDAGEPLAPMPRSEEEVMMLYTGGTTGLPKGVMYRMGNTVPSYLTGASAQIGADPAELIADVPGQVRAAIERGDGIVSVPCAPLMHGTGLCLGAMIPMCVGAEIVTLTNRSFDAHELLEAIEARRVTNLAIVGDAFSKPIIRAIDEAAARGRPYDLSSMRRIYSSGVMWTAEVKQQLIERMPQVVLNDLMNSTEGAMGAQVTARGSTPTTASFPLLPTTRVFTADDRPVEPGSDEVGFLAVGGSVPLGYYKDPEKTARTFRTIDGVRYSFPGDMARVSADGSIVLLGRGSQVVNTGGEKVFPEEVEESVKRVPGVHDCLVVGVDDEKFGQAVTAMVSVEPGAEIRPGDIIEHVKSELAGYKAPRRVVFVDVVPRAANGKADYAAARTRAVGAVGAG